MFLWPVPGHYEVSSGFDDWRDYGLHAAIDIPAPSVPCAAIGPGIVIWQGWAGSAGRSVYLDLGAGYRAHYCHLGAFNVTAGQLVDGQQVIGIVGGSGNGVDNYYGGHLHINLFAAEQPATGPSQWVAWVGKWAVDPELYLGLEDEMALTKEEHDWLATIHHYEKVVTPGALAHIHTHVQDFEARSLVRHKELLTAIKAIGIGGGGPTAQQIAEAVAEEHYRRQEE